MELLEIAEDGVVVRVSHAAEGYVRLSVSIAYNFVLAYQKNGVVLYLSLHDFINFIKSLSVSHPSKHGHSTIWSASQITVKAKHFPAQQFRDIRIHRRVFILGAFWVPGTLSGKIVQAIVSLGPGIEQALTSGSTRRAIKPARALPNH